jgi:predicted Zn-dependent peptidase
MATAPVVTTTPRQQIFTHTLPNGLTLVGQPMAAVKSVSFSFLLPLGSATDPIGRGGTANLLSEWVVRGAGERDNRALSEFLDGLGLQRGQGATRQTSSFEGVLLGPQLTAALEAYADILLRPRLDPAEFEQTRETVLQEIDAMEDQPTAKWSRELWRRWWPFPYGRPVEGTRAELEALTPQQAAEDWREGYRPQGAILAMAGDFDFPAVRDTVERLFGGWSGPARPAPSGPDERIRVSRIVEPIEQTHVGVACETVPFGHPDYYNLNIAVRVLSGGMGARLFTEVREKRALCYSVSAGTYVLRGQGALVAYANPEPPKADEALRVLLAELRRACAEGVTEAEVARAKTGVKSRLVQSNESTRSRAGIIAGDWFHLGRVRPTAEVTAAVDAVTVSSVNDFLRRHPFRRFTLVTLGPKEVETPDLD